MRPLNPAHLDADRSYAARIWRRCVARLTANDGFTVIELVVAMALSLVLFSATMYLLTSAMRAQTSQQTRITQLQEAQTSLQRIIRDLREATSVTYTSSSSISYSVTNSGTTTAVALSCSGTQCTRTAGGTAVVIASNLTSTSVFSASPSTTSPTAIGVTLQVAGSGHTSVTVADTAGLRNVVLDT